MIVHLSGHPGVGKLTIGRLLAEAIDGKLLDNHSIYNVGTALFEFRSPPFYDAVRAVREVAYRAVLALPPEVPVVLTNANFQESEWGAECWDAAVDLARRRGCPHLVAVLCCEHEEHMRRLAGPERLGKRKPRDPSEYRPDQWARIPLDRDGDRTFHLDTTGLPAEESARRLADWVRAG